MKNVYFLGRDYINDEHNSVETTLDFVVNLLKEADNSNIKKTTILIPTLYHLEMVSYLYFSRKPRLLYYKGHVFDVETCKTYTPFHPMRDMDNEILIALGVSSKDLEKYEGDYGIKTIVFMPMLLNDNLDFLNRHNAIDLESGVKRTYAPAIDYRIANAIEWLKSTSFPNEGFVNAFDRDRLRGLSNAIAKQKVPFDKESVIYHAIKSGINPESAHKIAEHFCKAKKRKFSLMYKDYQYKIILNRKE